MRIKFLADLQKFLPSIVLSSHPRIAEAPKYQCAGRSSVTTNLFELITALQDIAQNDDEVVVAVWGLLQADRVTWKDAGDGSSKSCLCGINQMP